MKRHLFLFPNKGTKAIFNYEIVGQLSDGQWENTLPYHHWRFWGELSTGVSPDGRYEFIKNGSVNEFSEHSRESWTFTAPTKRSGYNLLTLLDLASRMRLYYVDAEIGLGLEMDSDYLLKDFRHFMSLEELESQYNTYPDDEYWQRRVKILKKMVTKDTYDVIKRAYESYTEEDLKKDLREIKKAMRGVVNQFK